MKAVAACTDISIRFKPPIDVGRLQINHGRGESGVMLKEPGKKVRWAGKTDITALT